MRASALDGRQVLVSDADQTVMGAGPAHRDGIRPVSKLTVPGRRPTPVTSKLPVVEGLEVVRERFAAVFLIGGGLIPVVAMLLPGYLDATLTARLLVLAMALPTALSSLVVLRWGIPPFFVLPVAALGDLTVALETLTVRQPDSALLNVSSLAVLTFFAAVFGTRSTLIIQSAFANLVLLFVGPIAHTDPAEFVMFVLWSNFGLIVPGYAMYVLRRRLSVSTELARRLACTDPLTELLNRRGLAELTPALIRLAVQRQEPIGVIGCDLDHFKQLNDRYGHVEGDRVLEVVAGVLSASVRAEDAVVRIGGEEFAVVGTMPPGELAGIAQRIRSDVESACAHWQLTVSIGVAWQLVSDGDAEAAERQIWTIIDEADERTYRAKQTGRNRVVLPVPA